jgi:Zn-dependent peptidase ImmA (M78 family)
VHIYEEMKELAQIKRAEHNITTQGLDLNVVRRIYAAEKVKIDNWSFGPKVRAVYMCDDGFASVAVNSKLPREPRLFSLVHELKHHFVDISLIQGGKLKCGDYNANEMVEKAAEVFAAEFIYPEPEFLECVGSLGIVSGSCTPEGVVHLKRKCGACVSYQYLRKRLVRFGFAGAEVFTGVKFQKLEEEMFGVPIYKQAWFKARRAANKAARSD